MPILTLDSPNTTRVFGRTPQETSVAVSQMAFGRRAGAVILASADNPLDALSSLPLVHHLIGGPVLLTSPSALDAPIRDEIARLAPTGVRGVAQVVLVGALGDAVQEHASAMGLSSTRIVGINAYHTAAEVARFLGYPSDVILVSGQDPSLGLCAGALAAYAGSPILYTLRDVLPQETAGAIAATGRRTSVFIVGSRNVISDDVEASVREIAHGTVARISGDDPFELCVKFAKYRSADGRFGFGKSERGGHAFSFANPSRWRDAVCACVLAHSGKHPPLLFCETGGLAPVVRDYLLQVNPAAGRREPPFMHAFVVGDFDAVSGQAQLEIEETISIDGKAPSEVVHTVTPGEDLLGIARRYGVPIQDIAGANRIAEEAGLEPGSRLTIPYTLIGTPGPSTTTRPADVGRTL